MGDEVMPPWASLTTFVGLCGLLVLSFMRGWIIPRSTVEKIVERLERAIDERDSIIRELRAQNDALDRRNDLLAGQVHHLVASGYAAPAPIRAVVDSQADQVDDPGAAVPGARDPSGQSGSTSRGVQTSRNGKTRRRGSSRR